MDIATAKRGLVTTLGQASYVGATGSGLLLGMGLLGRSYGFTIDNLHAIGTTYFGVKQIIIFAQAKTAKRKRTRNYIHLGKLISYRNFTFCVLI